MHAPEDCVSATGETSPPLSTAERWLGLAKDDYRLCREFALRFDARLSRSLRSQRVGWESYGHLHFALLLPDPSHLDRLSDGGWYLYYAAGESMFRRTHAQCEQLRMLVLAESAEDWAELLRQALRERVFDVRYEVVPDYIDPAGETGHTATGSVFALEAYAPQATETTPLRIAGAGTTPEQAAREACRRWLWAQGTGTTSGAAGKTYVTR